MNTKLMIKILKFLDDNKIKFSWTYKYEVMELTIDMYAVMISKRNIVLMDITKTVVKDDDKSINFKRILSKFIKEGK